MTDQLKRNAESFDYVIIGAGSAGCVMANRLSEDLSSRVLLLEAGGHDRHYAVRVPAGMMKIKKEWDWNYPAEADPSRNGMLDTWPAGKLLGGGSSINAMCWVRGNRRDYDNWASTFGCAGWDYDSILPYFRRGENFEGGADDYRGVGGPQQVSYMRIDNPTIPAYLAAAKEEGISTNPDYNGAYQAGAGIGQVSQKNGLRESTARSYLAPALKRDSLTLRTHCQVTRILIEHGRAVGVEYHDKKGARHQVRAEQEVILSGGAIASPKILMLSGVGPEADLAKHGIEVQANAPGVGQNLMEHPHGYTKFRVNVSTLNVEVKPWPAFKHGVNFLVHRRGAVTTGFNQAILFAQSDAGEWVDIEMQMNTFGVGAAVSEVADEYGLAHEVHSVQFDKEPTITLMPAFLHPSSRGRITLASADPAKNPVIDYQLFGNRADLEGLMWGTKLARRVANQPSLRKLVVDEVLPGPSIKTDEDLEAYTRASGFTGKHPSGTCRMGSDDDSVLDPELRVRGVEALRVVDASVMPALTSGNTNAPTIVIAERASDLVKADRGAGARGALGLSSSARWPSAAADRAANGNANGNGASAHRDPAKAR